MPHDYIPRPDGDFSAWANHYVEAVHTFWEAQGLDLTDPDTPAPPLNSGASGAVESYKFLSLGSRGNLHAAFTSADAGKTAYDALRWVSTRGEQGPWSEVAAATVAA
jgi:hypothetical protein